MKKVSMARTVASALVLSALAFSPSLAQEKAPAPAPAKAAEPAPAPAKAAEPAVAPAAAPAAAKKSDGVISIPAPKIAVIDVQKIMRDSKAAQALREQLDDERRKHRDEISKLEDSLRDSQQELDHQRTVLSAQAFDEKRKEWERKAAELNRDIEGRKRKLDGAFEGSLGQIQASLVDVVRDIAKALDVTLVLAKTQVLLVSNEMDITEKALADLDKKLPSVKLSVGAAAPAAKAKTGE